MNLICILFFNSLICIGVFHLMRGDYLLSPLADSFDRASDRVSLLKKIRKPLFGCVACTASVWGLAMLSIVQPFAFDLWIPFKVFGYIAALMALNLILNGLIILSSSIGELSSFLIDGRR